MLFSRTNHSGIVATMRVLEGRDSQEAKAPDDEGSEAGALEASLNRALLALGPAGACCVQAQTDCARYDDADCRLETCRLMLTISE
jgi:hypothetical protein